MTRNSLTAGYKPVQISEWTLFRENQWNDRGGLGLTASNDIVPVSYHYVTIPANCEQCRDRQRGWL